MARRFRVARICASLIAFLVCCVTAGKFIPNSKFKPNEDGCDDRDREAAETVFQLPEATSPATRVSVPLAGLWEICRHDEQLPGPVAEPIRDLPQMPHWKAIQVPGDKNTLRPDLLFAHRLRYRTRVAVPASMAGRAFSIDFPYNNLNTTVYVNGVLCGFEKNPPDYGKISNDRDAHALQRDLPPQANCWLEVDFHLIFSGVG